MQQKAKWLLNLVRRGSLSSLTKFPDGLSRTKDWLYVPWHPSDSSQIHCRTKMCRNWKSNCGLPMSPKTFQWTQKSMETGCESKKKKQKFFGNTTTTESNLTFRKEATKRSQFSLLDFYSGFKERLSQARSILPLADHCCKKLCRSQSSNCEPFH